MYGPAHSLNNLCATWERERARISNEIIQFMIIESLAIFIFSSMWGYQMVMENRLRELIILWSGGENLVGRPKS